MPFRTLKQGKIIECLDCERRITLGKKIEDITFLRCTCGKVLISKLFKLVG